MQIGNHIVLGSLPPDLRCTFHLKVLSVWKGSTKSSNHKIFDSSGVELEGSYLQTTISTTRLSRLLGIIDGLVSMVVAGKPSAVCCCWKLAASRFIDCWLTDVPFTGEGRMAKYYAAFCTAVMRTLLSHGYRIFWVICRMSQTGNWKIASKHDHLG